MFPSQGEGEVDDGRDPQGQNASLLVYLYLTAIYISSFSDIVIFTTLSFIGCHQNHWHFLNFDQGYSCQCWWHCRYVTSSGVRWKVSMWAQRLSQLQGSPGQTQWLSGHQEPWHSSWLACGWCKAHCGCWSLDEHQRGCLWNCPYQFGSPCCLWQESRKKGMRRCVGQR